MRLEAFDKAKMAWEADIVAFAAQSGETFSDSMKIATLTRYGPECTRLDTVGFSGNDY